jgi:hypothetical protein
MAPSTRILVPALLLVAACADTTAPEHNPFGHYSLARINGDPLPAVVHETTVASLEFLRGGLRLNTDFTFEDVTELKVTPKSAGQIVRVSVDTSRGTFRLVRDTVFLDSTRGEHYHMVFQVAGSLKQELGTSTLIYRK